MMGLFILKVLAILEHLRGIKQVQHLSWSQLVRYLRNRYGIYQIGSGSYASVFYHKNWNHVYKIFEDDDGYMSFVKYCMANSSKHLPVFYRSPFQLHTFHRRVDTTSNKLWAVKVEKLDDLPDDVERLISSGALYKCLGSYFNMREHGRHETFSLRAGSNTPKEYTVAQFFDEYKHLDVEGVLNVLYDISKRIPFIYWMDLDLHSGNFMMRGNTLVIIDPIVGQNDSERFRISDWLLADNVISGPQYAKNDPDKLFS